MRVWGALLTYPDGTSATTIDWNSRRPTINGVAAISVGRNRWGRVPRSGLPNRESGKDWALTHFGPQIPATSLQARTEAVRDVLGAMRVPAVLLLGGDGASYREGYRQFLTMGVNPKAEVVAEELSAKARGERGIEFPAAGGSGHSEPSAGDGRNGIGGSAA